jgi:ribosomal protein S24E
LSKPVFDNNIEVRVISVDDADLKEISDLLKHHYQAKNQVVVVSRTKPVFGDQAHRLYVTILPRAGGANNE